MNWNNNSGPWGSGGGKNPWGGGSSNRDFEDTLKKARDNQQRGAAGCKYTLASQMYAHHGMSQNILFAVLIKCNITFMKTSHLLLDLPQPRFSSAENHTDVTFLDTQS